MRRLITAILLTGLATAPAFASAHYTLVRDTVGNCSAAVASPAGYPGMKVMSHKKYSSLDQANKSLDGLKGCSGFVR
jgi:hypothetical protein